MSGGSSQDFVTTAAHTKELLQWLHDKKLHKHNQKYHLVIHRQLRRTIKMCHCYSPAVNILARAFQIVVDQEIGAHGHGKKFVDKLNSVNKNFLMIIIMNLYVG